jgi:hypothetical protein
MMLGRRRRKANILIHNCASIRVTIVVAERFVEERRFRPIISR